MLSTPTLLGEPTSDSIVPGQSSIELRSAMQELRSAMQRVMAGAPRTNRVSERRREHRMPYPYLIKLSPADAAGEATAGEEIVVVGKHISPGGVDFYYREPLAHRWMIARLESSSGRVHTVLVELLWCRFNKHHWYENGGRFVRLIDEAAA